MSHAELSGDNPARSKREDTSAIREWAREHGH